MWMVSVQLTTVVSWGTGMQLKNVFLSTYHPSIQHGANVGAWFTHLHAHTQTIYYTYMTCLLLAYTITLTIIISIPQSNWPILTRDSCDPDTNNNPYLENFLSYNAGRQPERDLEEEVEEERRKRRLWVFLKIDQLQKESLIPSNKKSHDSGFIYEPLTILLLSKL